MQKKQKLILRILALFVLASLIFFFAYPGSKVEKPSMTATSTIATSTVTSFEVKTESLTDSDPTYDIKVEYPQLINAKPGSVEDRMNSQFKKEAQAMFEETSSELKSAAVGMEGREVIFERKLLSQKTYINSETGVISLAFNNYTDTGGAHGTFFYSSQSIDVKTGNKITLKDILKGDYVASLVKDIDKQIRTASDSCVRCDSLKDELDNLDVKIPDTFLLSDQGITFLYGAYELGSYASTASGQEVFVHKDFLNPFILRTW